MALEIERKFLVRVIPDIGEQTERLVIKQGYLFDLFGTILRVRKSNSNGFITIKRNTGKSTLGVHEYEYSVPGWLASLLLTVSFLGKIEKTRYNINYKYHTFELDVFKGHNQGLVIAEVELSDENEFVELPSWIGEEVTGQKKYSNKNLAKRK